MDTVRVERLEVGDCAAGYEVVKRMEHWLQTKSGRWQWIVILIAMYWDQCQREDSHR